MTFPTTFFERFDEADDREFYAMPRLVVHIDERAIEAVQDLFAEVLPPNGDYLDLMSSWRSHIPKCLNPQRVIGLGLNADELEENPQLDHYMISDINKDPMLDFEDDTFDGVMCTVSVQYMTRPIEIFSEVNRVLKPGAPFIVTFSNRGFPQKAISAWLSGTDAQHITLVSDYFLASGNWVGLSTRAKPGRRSVVGNSDPIYAVWARKHR